MIENNLKIYYFSIQTVILQTKNLPSVGLYLFRKNSSQFCSSFVLLQLRTPSHTKLLLMQVLSEHVKVWFEHIPLFYVKN